MLIKSETDIPLDHTDAIIESLRAYRQELIDAQPKRPVLPVAGLSRELATQRTEIVEWFAVGAVVASIPTVLVVLLSWDACFVLVTSIIIILGLPALLFNTVCNIFTKEYTGGQVRAWWLLFYAYLVGLGAICALENLFKVL